MKRLTVLALVALTACGGQAPAGAPVTQQTLERSTVVSPPFSVPAASTSTSSTSTTTTEPAPDPLQAWEESVGSYAKFAGPSMRNTPPVGIRSDGEVVELLSWDGREWVSRPVTLNDVPDVVHELWVADVTGDNVDEIVVSFFLGQDVFGAVFVNSGGTYLQAPIDNTANPNMPPGLLPNPQIGVGSVTGLEETCEPSCADGALLTVNYEWTGSGLVSSPGACLDYRPIQVGETVSICTKGGMIADLQEALMYFGYMRGSADGYFGPASRDALVKYQREIGEFQSGTISGGDVFALVEYYHQSESGDW